jgi:hypothetical protein
MRSRINGKARKKKVTSELQNWVRLLEAGSSGEHAKEYELVKSAVRSNSEVMGRFPADQEQS